MLDTDAFVGADLLTSLQELSLWKSVDTRIMSLETIRKQLSDIIIDHKLSVPENSTEEDVQQNIDKFFSYAQYTRRVIPEVFKCSERMHRLEDFEELIQGWSTKYSVQYLSTSVPFPFTMGYSGFTTEMSFTYYTAFSLMLEGVMYSEMGLSHIVSVFPDCPVRKGPRALVNFAVSKSRATVNFTASRNKPAETPEFLAVREFLDWQPPVAMGASQCWSGSAKAYAKLLKAFRNESEAFATLLLLIHLYYHILPSGFQRLDDTVKEIFHTISNSEQHFTHATFLAMYYCHENASVYDQPSQDHMNMALSIKAPAYAAYAVPFTTVVGSTHQDE